MSARNIKKSYLSSTGYFKSFKNDRQIAFESILERNFFLVLEFNNQVIQYEEQPITIYHQNNCGEKRKYTPDALVTYFDNTQKLIEVKYDDELQNKEEVREKLSLAKVHINENLNLDLEIFTDKNLDSIYLDNLKFLYKFVFIPVDSQKSLTISDTIQTYKPASIKQLLSHIDSNQLMQLQYIPYLWNYIFHNMYLIDPYKKLTMSTEFQY